MQKGSDNKKISIVEFIRLPRYFIILLITIYQKTISPDHGILSGAFPNRYCKYHPTCSEYSKKAFEKYGVVRGVVISTKRVLRCNPWSSGGVDYLK